MTNEFFIYDKNILNNLFLFIDFKIYVKDKLWSKQMKLLKHKA